MFIICQLDLHIRNNKRKFMRCTEFVRDLRQVGGFPPLIKLTATIYLK